MSVKMHKHGEDFLSNLDWHTDKVLGVVQQRALISFPNEWKLSILRGGFGFYSDGVTVEIAVICPDNEIAYNFGSIIAYGGNTDSREYGSYDVWGWVEPEHVEQLAKWVSEFDINRKHSNSMLTLQELEEGQNEVA
jgi:hypothetical protein